MEDINSEHHNKIAEVKYETIQQVLEPLNQEKGIYRVKGDNISQYYEKKCSRDDKRKEDEVGTKIGKSENEKKEEEMEVEKK